MADAAAHLVAKLTERDRLAALKYMGQTWRGVTAAELKKWIERTFYRPLAFQPWLNHPDIARIVDECEECPPVREALFGSVKDGQCTDPTCWKSKMDAYITHRIKSSEDGLVPMVRQYGEPERKTFAGLRVLSESNYEGLGSNAKKHCDEAVQGIVVDGPGHGDDHLALRRGGLLRAQPAAHGLSPERESGPPSSVRGERCSQADFALAVLAYSSFGALRINPVESRFDRVCPLARSPTDRKIHGQTIFNALCYFQEALQDIGW